MSSYYGKIVLKDLSTDNANEIICDRKIVLERDSIITVFEGYTVIDGRYFYTCTREDQVTSSFFLVNKNYIKLIKTRPQISETKIESFLKGGKSIENIYDEINSMIKVVSDIDYENEFKHKNRPITSRYRTLISQVSEEDIEEFHIFYRKLIDLRTSMREVLSDIKRIEGKYYD